jgi:hypothetical protein
MISSRDPLQLGSKSSSKSDVRRGRAFYSLTVAQTEYSKALLTAAAAAQDRICVHARQPTADRFSPPKTITAWKFMHRILLRNFVAAKQPDLWISWPYFHR